MNIGEPLRIVEVDPLTVPVPGLLPQADPTPAEEPSREEWAR